MSGRRRLLILLAGLVVVAGAAVGLLKPASSQQRLRTGDAAPLFSAPTVAGNGRVALADERGRTVLLNFWASWCVPCQQEFPVLKRASARHGGLVVLGVVFNDSSGAAASFMRAQHADWQSVIDPDARIASAYDVGNKPGIPVTVVIDSSGVVRGRHFGGFTSDADLDAALRRDGV